MENQIDKLISKYQLGMRRGLLVTSAHGTLGTQIFRRDVIFAEPFLTFHVGLGERSPQAMTDSENCNPRSSDIARHVASCGWTSSC